MEGQGMQKYKILKGEVVEGTGVSQKKGLFPCSGLALMAAHSD